MRAFYNVIYILGCSCACPFWLLRGFFDRKYLKNLLTRFLGPGRLLPKTVNKPRIWVWAMSLGEVLSARELVKGLVDTGSEVIISASTLAGLAAAKTAWPKLLVLPSPLDFSMSIRRFLDYVDPDLLVLVETDIWPGILMDLSQRKIPKVLVSARISPKSFKNYRHIHFFWAKILQLFELIAVQTDEDRDNYIKLGAWPDKTVVTGNLKFDQMVENKPSEKEAILAETGWPKGRWLVAGSTHTGEENIILKAFAEISSTFPDLFLLIAPRDRYKFNLTWHQIEKHFPGQAVRRSVPSNNPNARVFLLDSLGELEHFYELAELALVGKSWPGAHEGGGHNPLEPAARGKAVLSGPQIHNFKWMYKALVEAGAATLVDKKQLAEVLSDLLANPETIQTMGERGRQFVQSHHGTVNRTIGFIRPLIPHL